MEALIYEIADKHDHIGSLRFKIRKLEERIEELERKVQFREKIIRELRRVPKTVQHPQVRNEKIIMYSCMSLSLDFIDIRSFQSINFCAVIRKK